MFSILFLQFFCWTLEMFSQCGIFVFFSHFYYYPTICFRKYDVVQWNFRAAHICWDTRRCDCTIRGWLCINIDFVSFYGFLIGAWNCYDNWIIFVFHFISTIFLLDFGNVFTVWYFCVFSHFYYYPTICFRKYDVVQWIVRAAHKCWDTRRCDCNIRGWLCKKMSPTYQL